MGGSFGLSCSVDWELSEVDLFEVPAICAPFYHYSSVVATVTVHRKYSKTGLTRIQHATRDSLIFNPLSPTNQVEARERVCEEAGKRVKTRPLTSSPPLVLRGTYEPTA